MVYIVLDHSIKAILINPNKQFLKRVGVWGGGLNQQAAKKVSVPILCLPLQNKEKLKQKTQFHVWLKLAEWF